ncbi:MAG: hypothetical protein JO107_07240, partial [Hyphomicrobiales bacterium]|nr:hypothetical protein [Hyphomicrobiales bacterium]
MVNNTVLAAGCVILALGGLAFAFAGGETRADKRRAAVKKPDGKVDASTIDRAAKRKQIAENVRDLEKKSRRPGANLQTRIEQAGLTLSSQQFMLIFAGVAIVLGGLTY